MISPPKPTRCPIPIEKGASSFIVAIASGSRRKRIVGVWVGVSGTHAYLYLLRIEGVYVVLLHEHAGQDDVFEALYAPGAAGLVVVLERL
jgi:hypothetical protein